MGSAISTFNNIASAASQAFPPKSTFSVDQMPDLTGRVVIVTGESRITTLADSDLLGLPIPEGANTGVGKETVKVKRKDIDTELEQYSQCDRRC